MGQRALVQPNGCGRSRLADPSPAGGVTRQVVALLAFVGLLAAACNSGGGGQAPSTGTEQPIETAAPTATLESPTSTPVAPTLPGPCSNESPACAGHASGQRQPVPYVILVQGIDSSSTCGAGDVFGPRRDQVLARLRPLGVPDSHVIGFSYSDVYYDPATCSPVRVEDVATAGALPRYTSADTCSGVTVAASRLWRLLHSIEQIQPSATFTIVGHSMGGVVAAYFTATTNDQALLSRVHAIALLDSPVQGVPEVNSITSACNATYSASWQDMLPTSPVIATIGSQACARFDRFYAVAITPIGGGLACAPVNYAQGYTSGGVGAIVGGTLGTVGCASFAAVLFPLCLFVGIFGGTYVLDQLPAHSAAWDDPWALDMIANAFRAPDAGPSSPSVCNYSLGEVTIAAGNYQDFRVYARAGRIVSVSVSIVRDTTVDIDFVAYAPDSSVIANVGRVKTANVQFRSSVDGVYTVRLDNTYSYFTSKTVSMRGCAG